jgi:hypothetical protein
MQQLEVLEKQIDYSKLLNQATPWFAVEQSLC